MNEELAKCPACEDRGWNNQPLIGIERHVPCKTCEGTAAASKTVKSKTNAKGHSLDQMVRLCVENHTPEELAVGWLRYECVRRMNARQFGEMCKRNLGGEWFDDLVTAALLEWKEPNDGDSR